jgi:hypothetical protein
VLGEENRLDSEEKGLGKRENRLCKIGMLRIVMPPYTSGTHN